MSNHYHLILRVDRESALTWSDEEVVRRWGALCKGSEAFHATHDKPLSKTDLKLFSLKIPVWRERLHDISWFMKMLNEYISRRANYEDKCKGRFWESRFKSQALLDSRAILSAMAYVDLNPIRAKMAKSLITSDYTSIQERMVHHAKKHSPKSAAAKKKLPYRAQRLPTLLPFFDQKVLKSKDNPTPQALPFSFSGYVELVDWTGRQLRKDKRGAIPAHAKSALSDLGIDHNEWVTTVQRIRHGFGSAVGDA